MVEKRLDRGGRIVQGEGAPAAGGRTTSFRDCVRAHPALRPESLIGP